MNRIFVCFVTGAACLIIFGSSSVIAVLVSGSKNQVATVGSTATLTCPLYTCRDVQWAKGQPPITINGQKYSTIDSNYGCSLQITNVNQSDDNVYFCSKSASVLVIYLQVIRSGPSCKVDIARNDVAEGDNVIYRCNAEVGSYLAEIIWYDGNTTIQRSNKIKGSVADNHNILATSPSLKPFTCVLVVYINTTLYPNLASNYPTATVQCQTTGVDVLYTVKKAETSLAYSLASPGETVNCRASGNPQPIIQWCRNPCNESSGCDPVGENSATIILELRDCEESATYICYALNTVRGETKTVQSDKIVVKKEGKTARIGIIVGVVVGIIAALVIAGVIYKKCFS